MSFYPLKLSLADKTTGAPITTYTQLNLRWSNDSYAAAKYSQLAVSGGTYTFGSVGDPIVPGLYKLFDNTTELTAFGVIPIGEPQAVLLTADNTVSGDNTFSGANSFTGDTALENVTVNGNLAVTTGNNLTVADAPTNPTEVLRLEDADDFASLSTGNTFVGNQSFQDNVSFENDPPTCASPPVTGSSLCNQDYIQGIIDSIEVIPFQESSNKRRLIPSGTQDTNKVYTTWTAIQTNAASYAGTNWRINVEIVGAGESSNNITVASDFEDFVDINYQKVTLQIDDASYSVAALGNVTVADIDIARDDDGAGTPTFTNFVFKNVNFNFDTASIGFVNCKFMGNNTVKNTGSISFDGNCIGGYVATNGAITARMFGTDGLTSTDF